MAASGMSLIESFFFFSIIIQQFFDLFPKIAINFYIAPEKSDTAFTINY